MVAEGAQACFAGYLYMWAFADLASTHASVCFMWLLRWSAAAAISDKRLTYAAFCFLRWDSIRLPTERPLWNLVEELEPCHVGLVGRQAGALSA